MFENFFQAQEGVCVGPVLVRMAAFLLFAGSAENVMLNYRLNTNDELKLIFSSTSAIKIILIKRKALMVALTANQRERRSTFRTDIC